MPERAKLFVLVEDDDGACRWQARFTIFPNQRVHVIAMISGTHFVDRTVSIREARDMWRDLYNRGWRRPRRTRVLKESALRRDILDMRKRQ